MKRQYSKELKTKKKKNMSLWDKLQPLQGCTLKLLERWLTNHLSYATAHLPTKGELIFRVFKDSLIILFLVKRSQKFREKISCMPEFLQKSSWTIFLDKLSLSDDQNSLTINLLQTLLPELISKERDFRPFWTSAYKELSATLSLPSKTDSVDLDSNLSRSLLNFHEKSSLIKKTTSQMNKNFQTTCYPLCKSFVAKRWEKESTQPAKLRTLKIKMYPNSQQKKQINEFIDTSRYIYNKTLEQLKKGHPNNFFDLRDLLVTNESKKGNVFVVEYDGKIKEVQEKLKNANELEIGILKKELEILKKEKVEKMKSVTAVKNPFIKEFELRTPKEIRANAVKQCCDAMKAGISNLKNGNIKFFNMRFRKKSSKQQGIEIAPSGISFQDGQIKLLPRTFGKDCFIRVHNRMKKKILRNNIQIAHNVDIIRNNNKEYFLYLVIPTAIKEKKKESGIPIAERVCGIDLGVRTFATVFSNNLNSNETKVIEYNHKIELLKKLNSKIDFLKSRKRIRRNQMSKYEKRKKNLVDSIHWNFIKDILKESDIIFLGLIKSHNIVRGGKNKNLNRDVNDLKFYLLKERLVYKASVCQKKVVLVKEHFTTQTCSNCGWLNKDIGSSKVFNCLECKLEADRDSNAAKNILLKGILN